MLYGIFGDTIYNYWLFGKMAGESLVFSSGLSTLDPNLIILPAQPLIILQMKILGAVFAPVTAYNIMILLGFMLTAFAGYLLSGQLIKNKYIRILVGFLITILPYHYIHSQYHISLVSTHWLLFFIYFLFELRKNPNIKNLGLLAIFGLLTMTDNYQYGAFALLISIIFLLCTVCFDLFAKKYSQLWIFLKYILGSGILGGALIAIFDNRLFLSLFSEGGLSGLGPQRSLGELTTYSAQWIYYFLPSQFLAGFGQTFSELFSEKINTLGVSIEEQTLFLGWITVAFAVFSLFIKKSKDEVSKYLTMVAILLFFFVTSFSPQMEIFGLTINSPSKWLFEHFPVVRVYSRFGFVVGAITMILFGYCLEKVLLRLKYKKIIFVVVCILAVAQFIPTKPIPLINTREIPKIYTELQKLPRGTLAEYPFLPADETTGYKYLQAQVIHHFELINFPAMNSEGEGLRKVLLDLSKKETILGLSERGVKYIITHEAISKKLAKKLPMETNSGILQTPNPEYTEKITCIDEDCLYKIRL